MDESKEFFLFNKLLFVNEFFHFAHVYGHILWLIWFSLAEELLSLWCCKASVQIGFKMVFLRSSWWIDNFGFDIFIQVIWVHHHFELLFDVVTLFNSKLELAVIEVVWISIILLKWNNIDWLSLYLYSLLRYIFSFIFFCVDLNHTHYFIINWFIQGLFEIVKLTLDRMLILFRH